MPTGPLVKYVFDEMVRMSDLGFTSWVSDVQKVLVQYNLYDHLEIKSENFSELVNNTLRHQFLITWRDQLTGPIARTYILFNKELKFANYLSVVKIINHRKALAQLRCSSHHLAIETGRWSGRELMFRICPSCRMLEDENHFVCDCRINRQQRAELSNYIFSVQCGNSSEKFNSFRSNLFVNLMASYDESLLRSFARFCYSSFKAREKLFGKS